MLSFNTDGDFKDNYRWLIGAVVPRPIAVVSTLNLDGSNNLAPFSFFNAVCPKPMIISFCPTIRTKDGSKKDTVINIEREKEFVVNFATEELATKINLASTELPYGQDEFKYAGLTPINSEKVKARRLKESPIHFECKLRDILNYGDEPGAGRLITGEVVKIHIDESVLTNNRIDIKKYKAIARGAGNDWFRTSDVFEMERLMTAQIQK